MNLMKTFLFKIDDFLKSLGFLDFVILFIIRIYLFLFFGEQVLHQINFLGMMVYQA